MKPVYRDHFHCISIASELELHTAASLSNVKTLKYIVIHLKQTDKDHIGHKTLSYTKSGHFQGIFLTIPLWGVEWDERRNELTGKSSNLAKRLR